MATVKKAAKAAAASFQTRTSPTTAFEVPEGVRELAEKSVSQAREAYTKMKTAADDTAGLIEETFETSRRGAFALGAKALDAAKVNSDASFAHARDLFAAKSVSEFIELQSTFARRQFEAMTEQVKEFQKMTEKVVTDATKPVAAKVEKTFRDLTVA
jgi:phasin